MKPDYELDKAAHEFLKGKETELSDLTYVWTQANEIMLPAVYPNWYAKASGLKILFPAPSGDLACALKWIEMAGCEWRMWDGPAHGRGIEIYQYSDTPLHPKLHQTYRSPLHAIADTISYKGEVK